MPFIPVNYEPKGSPTAFIKGAPFDVKEVEYVNKRFYLFPAVWRVSKGATNGGIAHGVVRYGGSLDDDLITSVDEFLPLATKENTRHNPFVVVTPNNIWGAGRHIKTVESLRHILHVYDQFDQNITELSNQYTMWHLLH